ncbi:polyprenyl synthetase family protein [Campylobacter gastrosuis]|uniref:Polyprenyl synthetase family protein n=1 Tax=Campylobacter gastrosuis TaxID=2974576 RepID=A0ABT7HRD9_9BACT|nr:polyprenyl synthetase family protein [Campylobacter gastrosuis]MDL0089482.1 polyprenyl synthetase family protein [Campylobacter gastrosuis]
MNFTDFLNENLPTAPSFHPHYEIALSDMLKAGGKHFRASLLLGVVSALKPRNLAAAMRVALGVELLHTYSLIHDDLPVMDNAPLRRGKPTLHVKYDEVTAVLAGDALNTHAFFEISRANLSSEIRIKCVEILSQNGGASGMVLGQAIDCFFEKKPLTLDELKFLHTHKTAKLIAASLKMGAVIAECDEKMCDEIYELGLDLGLAFQIQDDIIDATSDESEAGKPVHNDSVKNSFTNLLGVSGAISYKNEILNGVKNRLKSLPQGVCDMILELVKKHL